MSHPARCVALSIVTLLGGIAAAPAGAHETLKLEAPKPLLAPAPPMGWNSWNKFGCNINEDLVRKQADAMVSSGMKDAGFAASDGACPVAERAGGIEGSPGMGQQILAHARQAQAASCAFEQRDF